MLGTLGAYISTIIGLCGAHRGRNICQSSGPAFLAELWHRAMPTNHNSIKIQAFGFVGVAAKAPTVLSKADIFGSAACLE